MLCYIQVIRVKNRFLQPTPAGFRDILISAMVEHIGPSGRPTHFICEYNRVLQLRCML